MQMTLPSVFDYFSSFFPVFVDKDKWAQFGVILRFIMLLNISRYLLNYTTFVMSETYSFLMIHLELENLFHFTKKKKKVDFLLI